MILSSARAPHGAGVATAAALATGFDPNQEKARHAQYHRDLSESLTFLGTPIMHVYARMHAIMMYVS